MKKCIDCGRLRPTEEFHPTGKKDYRMSYCKPCGVARTRRWRENNRERSRAIGRGSMRRWRERHPDKQRARNAARYGLTLDEYDAIIARGCAICGTHEGKICLDHDHANGRVRDALCHGCNVALGYAREDPERLRAAADYIEAHHPRAGRAGVRV